MWYINDSDISIEQLADELIIARLFADATVQAGIKPEELPDAPVQTKEEGKK